MRITPRQNPHFYLGLPKDALSYGSKFHTDSLKDFGLGLGKEASTIYVLVDKSCRLFLDAAKPHIPRIFGNLWKPHQTVILKGKYSEARCTLQLTSTLDVGGILESEHIVYSKIGTRQDFWHRPSITDSSQCRTQQDYSYDDSEIVNKPVANWRALLDAALECQNVDLMVRDQSRPNPPADSGWVSYNHITSLRLAHSEILIRHSFLLRNQTVYQGSENRQHLGRPPRTCLSNSQTPAVLVLAEPRFLLQLSRLERSLIPLILLFPRKRELSFPNPSIAGSTMRHLDSPPRLYLGQNTPSQTSVFLQSAATRFLLLQPSRLKRPSIPLRFLFPRKSQLTYVLNPSTAGSTTQHPESLTRHCLGPNTQSQIPVFPVVSVAARFLLQPIRSKRPLTPLTFLFPYNQQRANLPNPSTVGSSTRQHLDSPSRAFPS